jgi:hypothetical protein
VDEPGATLVKLNGIQIPKGILTWKESVCPAHDTEKSLGSPPSLRSQPEMAYAFPGTVVSVWDKTPSDATGPRYPPKFPLWTKNPGMLG